MILKNTAYTLTFLVGTVGLAPAVTISKDGAAFAAPAGAVSEIGNGWYKIPLSSSEMNADNIAVHITITGYNPLDVLINTDVVSTPDNAGIAAIKAKTDNLPAAPAAVSDIPTAATNAAAVRTNLATELGRIDAATSTRLPSSSYTAPDNAGITAIKAKTDNLPATPAATSDIPTAATNATAVRNELATELARVDAAVSSRLAGGSYVAPDNANIAAVAAKLPTAGAKIAGEGTTAKNLDDVAASGTAPTAAENAAAVRTELTTEMARIDVAISTRMAGTSTLPTLATVIGDAVIVSEDPSATFTLDELSS